ncbi:hypothetical protein VISP3789_00365 [Vibrio splendidus ATCC 33789]|nr:hypothetical protein VISP3789_00365 [Vibrio splendidus ATCC 33789]
MRSLPINLDINNLLALSTIILTPKLKNQYIAKLSKFKRSGTNIFMASKSIKLLKISKIHFKPRIL